jgi:hypothetical protein
MTNDTLPLVARGIFVFWDSKRPITIALLQRLDLAKLADELGFVLEK